jgi:hypothetical protein
LQYPVADKTIFHSLPKPLFFTVFTQQERYWTKKGTLAFAKTKSNSDRDLHKYSNLKCVYKIVIF